MDLGRKGLFVLALITNCLYANCRSLLIYENSGADVNIFEIEGVKNKKACTLCEQLASEAIYYLGENKTQTEIVDSLHVACSRLHSFSQECISLVDYYTPLLFMEIALFSPEEFCSRVNLCENSSIFSKLNQDGCETCHHAVAEIILKLKDPDTQLEVVEILLKGCEKVENHVKECKKLVLHYGPILMTNAEKFFEDKDVCKIIHACNDPATAAHNFPEGEIRLPSQALNELN